MSQSLEYQSDGDWDVVRRNNDIIEGKVRQPLPNARVFNNAALATATGVALILTFNSERWDTANMHSTVTNPSRLTAPITGLYSIGAAVEYAIAAAGRRRTLLQITGTTIIAVDERLATASATRVVLNTEYRLAAGDYVEVQVLQDSGGALNIGASPNFSPEFWMHRISGYTNEGIA